MIELDLAEIDDIQKRLQKFIDKVESNRARSKETYVDVKYIFNLLERKKLKYLKERLTKCSDGQSRRAGTSKLTAESLREKLSGRTMPKARR